MPIRSRILFCRPLAALGRPSAALALFLALPPVAHAAPGADEILKAVDSALFLESYSSKATLETVEPSGEKRSMSFEGLSRRDKGTYLEITAPARTKGTRFLQLEGSLWMFNPKSGSASPIRLSSRDSFQGSTFSNADVGKSQFADDYEASLEPDAVLSHAELGDVQCHVVSAKAKSDSAAYGRIVMWVRKADYMPLRMEYYAKSGLLYKRMDLSRIKSFGQITRPSVMRMESLEKRGTITTLVLEFIEKREVGSSVFNRNYLTR
jgi:outer membrane lipoprotein-sorting protein